MKTAALRHVRKMFVHPDACRRTQRHNMRQWVKSVRYLGDRWLLATSVRRTPDARFN